MGQPILHLSIAVADLDEACVFYESVFGCRIGRARQDWRDVWFFGLQLTLHLQPDEVVPPGAHGVRHFGVVLPDEKSWTEVVGRAAAFGAQWLSPPAPTDDPALSGKRSATLADPSGNVIEVKYYPDPEAFLAVHPD